MTTPADVTLPHGRPVRKDEIEIQDRGLYIESWLPERRSRRKPCASSTCIAAMSPECARGCVRCLP